MILATISVIWGCWRIKKWDYKKCSLNFAMIFPFPVIPGNNNVSFPFPKFGNGISIPVPVPKNWEWNFHSRSRSQKLGIQFFIPVPVPKVWEWAEPFPFPFPNVQKSFPLTPVPLTPDIVHLQLFKLTPNWWDLICFKIGKLLNSEKYYWEEYAKFWKILGIWQNTPKI